MPVESSIPVSTADYVPDIAQCHLDKIIYSWEPIQYLMKMALFGQKH